jgi:uncharacterized protein
MPETSFEVYKDKGGEWRWRLKAENHQIVASSEGYKEKRDAIESAASMKRWVANAAMNEMIEEDDEG